MSHEEFHAPENQERAKMEVINTLGIASDLIEKPETLRKIPMWMGIGTNEKTYPDTMVLDYAKWISEHSDSGLVVIADELQLYNKIPTSSKSWGKLEEVETVRQIGAERKKRLSELLQQSDVKNVAIIQWRELIDALMAESGDNDFLINYDSQLFDSLRQDPDFDRLLMNIAEKQAPSMFQRFAAHPLTKDHMEHVRFATSLYTQEEIFLTYILSVLQKYPIKVGHAGEQVYDEITLQLLQGKFGPSLKKSTPFGAIHLKRAV